MKIDELGVGQILALLWQPLWLAAFVTSLGALMASRLERAEATGWLSHRRRRPLPIRVFALELAVLAGVDFLLGLFSLFVGPPELLLVVAEVATGLVLVVLIVVLSEGLRDAGLPSRFWLPVIDLLLALLALLAVSLPLS